MYNVKMWDDGVVYPLPEEAIVVESVEGNSVRSGLISQTPGWIVRG